MPIERPITSLPAGANFFSRISQYLTHPMNPLASLIMMFNRIHEIELKTEAPMILRELKEAKHQG